MSRSHRALGRAVAGGRWCSMLAERPGCEMLESMLLLLTGGDCCLTFDAQSLGSSRLTGPIGAVKPAENERDLPNANRVNKAHK